MASWILFFVVWSGFGALGFLLWCLKYSFCTHDIPRWRQWLAFFLGGPLIWMVGVLT